MQTARRILSHYYDHSIQVDSVLTFVFGAYSAYIVSLVLANPGTAPQPMIDAWTYFHFMFGIVTAYMLYKFLKSRRNPRRKIVAFSMLIQIGWKAYEFAFGYSLFVQSIPNVLFDLFVGLVGAIIVAYVLVYAVFRKPY